MYINTLVEIFVCDAGDPNQSLAYALELLSNIPLCVHTFVCINIVTDLSRVNKQTKTKTSRLLLYCLLISILKAEFQVSRLRVSIREMSYWVKEPTDKPEDLSSIPQYSYDRRKLTQNF